MSLSQWKVKKDFILKKVWGLFFFRLLTNLAKCAAAFTSKETMVKAALVISRSFKSNKITRRLHYENR